MTKKETAQFEALRKELRIARALRFTEEVKPDVAIPESACDLLSKGWIPIGPGTWSRVEPACSSSVSHAVSRTDKTTSQGPVRLYSSKLLALRQLRHGNEMAYAEHLARIDEQIEKEIAGEQAGGKP